jgi:Zn ribbon nucleic-acid-binding protein
MEGAEYESDVMRNTVLDALKRKEANAQVKCPACAQPEWAFVSGATVLIPIMTADGQIARSGDRPGGFQAVPITCVRCGYIRFHALTTLVAD